MPCALWPSRTVCHPSSSRFRSPALPSSKRLICFRTSSASQVSPWHACVKCHGMSMSRAHQRAVRSVRVEIFAWFSGAKDHGTTGTTGIIMIYPSRLVISNHLKWLGKSCVFCALPCFFPLDSASRSELCGLSNRALLHHPTRVSLPYIPVLPTAASKVHPLASMAAQWNVVSLDGVLSALFEVKLGTHSRHSNLP